MSNFGDFLLYSEFKRHVQTELSPKGITTCRRYYKYIRNTLNHSNKLPKSPRAHYLSEWEGWPEVFGKDKFYPYEAKSFPRFDYAGAKYYVQTFLVPIGIDSTPKYERAYKLGKIDKTLMPLQPRKHYANSGWVSAKDFFRVRPTTETIDESHILPYEGAKYYVQTFLVSEGVVNHKTYQHAFITGKLPTFLPENPKDYYLNSGWFGDSDFYGCSGLEIEMKTT